MVFQAVCKLRMTILRTFTLLIFLHPERTKRLFCKENLGSRAQIDNLLPMDWMWPVKCLDSACSGMGRGGRNQLHTAQSGISPPLHPHCANDPLYRLTRLSQSSQLVKSSILRKAILLRAES